MEQRRLLMDEQIRFTERTLPLGYPGPGDAAMAASQLLECPRPEDIGVRAIGVQSSRVFVTQPRGGHSRSRLSRPITL